MNLILIEQSECREGAVALVGRRAAHIVKVLKSSVGEKLKVGEVNGRLGTGVITEIRKKKPFSVSLTLHFDRKPKNEPFVDLVLALPRPIMLKRILSQLTALGTNNIHLIHANRVEKSFWEASLLENENFREHLLIGLEQCVDTKVPSLLQHNRFKVFVEDYLPTIKNDYDHLILADPGGKLTLKEQLQGKNGRVLLAVGPEGGWVEYEIDKLCDQGFVRCSMGDRILKVDTAVIALHGQLTGIMG